MHENKIAGKIRKGAVIKFLLSVPLLVAAMILICLMAASGLFSAEGYFYFAPLDVSRSLSAIDDIARRPLGLETFNVSLTAPYSDMVDPEIQKTEDGKPVGNYLAVFLDDKYVYCYIRAADYEALAGDGYTFTGSLRKMEPKLISMAVEDMVEDGISQNDADNFLYGYYIDTTDNGAFARTFLYILTLLLLFFGLLAAARTILALIDVRNFSQVRKLSKYGDRDMLFEQIEEDYAVAEDDVFSLGRGRGSVCLGDRWIVVLGGFGGLGVKFMRAEDLLWAYKLKRTTRYYGVISAGTYHFLMLRGKTVSLSVAGREQSVDMLLFAISGRYPWAIVGYSAELEAAWKSDRSRFAGGRMGV
jgi:hypothetical protein